MNLKTSRNEILALLQTTLEPLDYVYAMWEGGSAAFGRLDQWSDIDLQFDVDDDHVADTFSIIETTLKKISPIERQYHTPQLPWESVFQTFYQLQDVSPYLLMDVVVIQHKAKEKLLQEEIHGKACFYFDKSGVSKIPPFDLGDLKVKLLERLSVLRITFPLFQSMVIKELNRGSNLDALDFYHQCTMRPLVELLRMRYKPARYNFHIHYTKYDLPPEVVAKLESLYFVAIAEEIKDKRQTAEEWFYEVFPQVEGNLSNYEKSST